MKSLYIKCASDTDDTMRMVGGTEKSYLHFHRNGWMRASMHLTTETAQQLVDWLTEWIEQSKLVCGWARVEEEDGTWTARVGGLTVEFNSRETAVAWVEALTAEVRK